MGAVNIDPIYSRVGDVSSNGTTGFAAAMVNATGDYTGVSANYVAVFTADATNGSFLDHIRFKATGNTVASAVRVFINNGSNVSVASNNVFFGEVSLPAVTATNTAGTPDIDYPIGMALNPGFVVYCGLATSVAASWVATAVGGKY